MHIRDVLLLPFAAVILVGYTAVSSSQTKIPGGAYTIAFASFAPLRTNVFIANGDGELAKPLLAKPDVDYNPSLSSDGVWIVFTSNRGRSADIYRVHPDGSGLERLTDDPAFDDQGVLSPDGRTLAFVSTRGGRANIWLLDLSSRTLRNLTPDSAGDFRPAWSPDGEWIAFSSDRESTHPTLNFGVLDTTQVYVMSRNGSQVRRISSGDGTSGSPSWSPDGSRIAYYSTAVAEIPKVVAPQPDRATVQIVAVNWRTGEAEVLRGGPGAKWSPRWLSATRVVYASEGPSGGIERTDGSAGARGEFWNANWSSDGRVMVFHRDTESVWPPLQEWTSLEAGFRLVRTGIFPSYSPSGDRLVCNSGRAGILHNAMVIMNADGTHRRVLFEEARRSALAPAWSPVGDHIAFALGEFFPMVPGRENVTSQLAIINADGSGLRVLAAAGDHAGFPSWAPDGKRLVYRVSDHGRRSLRLIELATDAVSELTSGPQDDNFPAWSPHGDRIAFTSNRNGDYEIYTVRSDGTELTRLTRGAGNDAHLAWSRDGQWIAFASARTGFTDEALLHPGNPQQNGEIFVMRADGSNVRRLTVNPFEDATPTWRPSLSKSRSPQR